MKSEAAHAARAERARTLQALALRSGEGDLAALTQLVVESRPDLRRFARRVCSTHEDAEDAVQATLLILSARTGLLRAVSRFMAWAFAVVRNHCVRLARAALRHRPLDDGQLDARLEQRLASLDDLVLARELASHLASLPAAYREVFVLRELEGLSGPEAAEVLGSTGRNRANFN
jgi:RNA polymerase sigma factor (sigma-70 family)